MKQAEVTKVQEKEKALTEAFQETVADNPFEEFLTRVFKKMVKRNKEKDRNRGGKKWLLAVFVCCCVRSCLRLSSAYHLFTEDEDSDEDSDEDWDDWDDDFDSSEEGAAPLSDSVCPQGALKKQKRNVGQVC